MKDFKSPYKGVPDTQSDGADWIRISIDVSKKEVMLVRSILMDWGATHTCLSMFARYLYDYVTKHNLTLAQRDQFIEHIRRKCDVDFDSNACNDASGCTTRVVDGKGTDTDDGRGAGSVYQRVETTSDVKPTRKRKPAPTQVQDSFGGTDQASTTRQGGA